MWKKSTSKTKRIFPEYDSGSGSRGCGDDEPGDDEDGDEDEEDEEDEASLLSRLFVRFVQSARKMFATSSSVVIWLSLFFVAYADGGA
ncbi:hypothetical protein Tco_1054690 [Tanacetum coccineum]|uniref:Uncharacterized protein n=1 Tax=Tanacetum coccineum TaxID=301880 RepID=A0ABQ5GZW5_9ASTR